MEKYLENEFSTSASRDVAHAHECSIGWAYSMPW
jgi:hypothetical protein